MFHKCSYRGNPKAVSKHWQPALKGGPISDYNKMCAMPAIIGHRLGTHFIAAKHRSQRLGTYKSIDMHTLSEIITQITSTSYGAGFVAVDGVMSVSHPPLQQVMHWSTGASFQATFNNNDQEFHSVLAMGQGAGRYVIKNSWG